MGPHVVGPPHSLRFFLQFPLQALKSIGPMAPVGLVLSTLLLVEELKLVRVGVATCLANAVALRLQKSLQRRRLNLATVNKILDELVDLRDGTALQLGAEIRNVLLSQEGHARCDTRRDRVRITNSVLEVFKGGVLTAFTQRLKWPLGSVSLCPDGRDRYDLFVKPRCARPVK
jgi:hypothetical protein